MEIKEKISISCPRDTIGLLSYFSNKSVEHFGIICLNSNHQVISKASLFKGGYTRTVVDPRVCLYYAIKHKAVAVIVWHNHPSGNPEPSEEDLSTTKDLKKAFKICGMQVLDHVIVSKHSYYSFLEHDKI